MCKAPANARPAPGPRVSAAEHPGCMKENGSSCRAGPARFVALLKAGNDALPPTRRRTMRVLVIVKASKESEAGVFPSEKELTDMTAFNEQLVKAGVMLAGEGLHPSSKGKRVRFEGKNRTVIDGPFAETKELVAGYWLWQVRNIDEAVEWLK